MNSQLKTWCTLSQALLSLEDAKGTDESLLGEAGPMEHLNLPRRDLVLWECTSEPRRKDRFQGERHSAGQSLSPLSSCLLPTIGPLPGKSAATPNSRPEAEQISPFCQGRANSKL